MTQIESITHHLKATRFMERTNLEKAKGSNRPREKERFQLAATRNHQEAVALASKLERLKRGL